MDKKNSSLTTNESDATLAGMDALCRHSIELIHYARKVAASQVNLVQLMTYYHWVTGS